MGPRKRQGPSLANKEKRQKTDPSKRTELRNETNGNESQRVGKNRDNAGRTDIPKDKDQKATLYVQNLNDQISIGDLRAALYMLFSSYGHLVAINAHKSPKMRGQAHIVYALVDDAAQALHQLQGKPFLDKPLKIAYAKSDSKRLNLAKG